MNQVQYYFESCGHFVDTATIRAKFSLSKSTAKRKLDALEKTKTYTVVQYGNRKLYHVSILDDFTFPITMGSQKDATNKNNHNE